MKPIDEESSRQMWESYVRAHPEFIDESPPTESFGDSAEMADELLDVVLNGPKRATAGLVAEYVHEHETLRRIGDHWIVADADGIARGVLRSIELRIGHLDSVDAQFAWDEGEGDRSLDWWLDAHRRFSGAPVHESASHLTIRMTWMPLTSCSNDSPSSGRRRPTREAVGCAPIPREGGGSRTYQEC